MVDRVKKNVGFLLAGAILIGVVFNVWWELNSAEKGSEPCPCISTQ